MKLVKLFYVILFLCYFANVEAQVREWTYSECLEYALENNLSVKRGELDMEFNEVNLKQSKADIYPSLNFGSQYGVNWGR
jgi:outer membrane protein